MPKRSWRKAVRMKARAIADPLDAQPLVSEVLLYSF